MSGGSENKLVGVRESARTPVKPAFYISPKGSDSNDGSLAHPFATLSRARAAMERSATHTTYVEGGTYHLTSTLTLSSVDSGMSFVAYPGQTPILSGYPAGLATLVSMNGAKNITLSGLGFANAVDGAAALSLINTTASQIVGNLFTHNDGDAIVMTGSSGNTVSGNEADDSGQSAIEAKDGSNNNIFDSNIINRTGTVGTVGAGFFFHGVSGNIISHNLVENTAGLGIGIENWDSATINVGNRIEYNIVRNANTSIQAQDSGSIYMLGRSHVDTKSVILGNLIDGTGNRSNAHTIGIYLDDSTSGVRVEFNIIRDVGTHGLEIHGGDDIIVRNNIIDLGPRAVSAILFQAAPLDTHPTNTMLNQDVTRNIFYAATPNQVAYSYIDGGKPNISGNLYYNASGARMKTAPPTRDANPVFGDPKFVDAAASNYALQWGSAATAIGFHPIDQSLPGLRPLKPHRYPTPK